MSRFSRTERARNSRAPAWGLA